MHKRLVRYLTSFWLASAFVGVASPAAAGQYVFSVSGDKILLNEQPYKALGLRLSNGLVSDSETQELIDNLDLFKSYGVNTVSVFMMGSRFGDVKGYLPDSRLDPVYSARLGRIIEAADARGMVVLVGCLYWSTSRAKEDLEGVWNQASADLAVANTVSWLSSHDYRNVFVDPDNEGMAHDATGWSIASMIDAAHAVDPSIMVAYNDAASPPDNADLYIHHSSVVSGKPWLQSEGEAPNASGGYWGSYSKADGYYNYIRIGRYTESMKSAQISKAKSDIDKRNGYMMASTWIQAAPSEGIGGPFMNPGGKSDIADVNQDERQLHPDAGILWWLEAMKEAYGAWLPPAPNQPPALGGGGGGGGGGGVPSEPVAGAMNTPTPQGGMTSAGGASGVPVANAGGGTGGVIGAAAGSGSVGDASATGGATNGDASGCSFRRVGEPLDPSGRWFAALAMTSLLLHGRRRKT